MRMYGCRDCEQSSAANGCPKHADPIVVGSAAPGSTPHKCPVCNGTGLVSVPPGVAGDVETFSSSQTGPWPCRACGGSGVLWR